MVLHEALDELQVILLPDGEVRVGLAVAEQVVDEAVAELLGKIDGTLVVVGAHLPARVEARAALLHGAGEKGIDGAGEVEIEVGDGGQVAERRMRRGVEAVEKLGHLLVDVLARPPRSRCSQATRLKEAGGEPFGGSLRALASFGRESAIDRDLLCAPRDGGHRQLGANDGNHLPVVDIEQQVAPLIFFEEPALHVSPTRRLPRRPLSLSGSSTSSPIRCVWSV